MTRALLTLPLGLVLAGCIDMAPHTTSSAQGGAQTQLADASGAPRGVAKLTDVRDGLMVQLDADGLPPGTHGVHIHGVGRCDAPGFQSAGGHWNPSMKQHGRDNPQGAHNGDLPNLVVGADGRGALRFTLPDATLANLLDADGAALVVHASADDYRTDPSGNSGARIACGVIGR